MINIYYQQSNLFIDLIIGFKPILAGDNKRKAKD